MKKNSQAKKTETLRVIPPPYTRAYIADGKPGEGVNRNFYRRPKAAKGRRSTT
jgi:hypothetical protein